MLETHHDTLFAVPKVKTPYPDIGAQWTGLIFVLTSFSQND